MAALYPLLANNVYKFSNVCGSYSDELDRIQSYKWKGPHIPKFVSTYIR